MLGVDGGDDQQRPQVIEDGQGEQEHPQPRGYSRREQRQRPERERGVRRHRRPPAASPCAAGIEREVDEHRRKHPAERCHHGDRQPLALAELTGVELALGLEPDDEEEERHQAVVHPVAEVL